MSARLHGSKIRQMIRWNSDISENRNKTYYKFALRNEMEWKSLNE